MSLRAVAMSTAAIVFLLLVAALPVSVPVTALDDETNPGQRETLYEAAHSGRVGALDVLATNERLSDLEMAGDIRAADARAALADALLTTPEAWPDELRAVLVARSADFTGTYRGPIELARVFRERSALGQLLARSHRHLAPTEELGVAMARQATDLIGYLTAVDENVDGRLPVGFRENDRLVMQQGAQAYLTVATRNPAVADTLLTGRGLGKAEPATADHRPRPFDAAEFRATVFRHEWPVEGAAVGGLLEWIAATWDGVDETAARAQYVTTELSSYFVPTSLAESGHRVFTGEGDTTAFDHYARAFRANPRLADALAAVMARAIESSTGTYVPTGRILEDRATPSGRRVLLGGGEIDYLLFLAAQSSGGRLIMETARQEFERQYIARLSTGTDIAAALATMGSGPVDLESRVTTAIARALTYQNRARGREEIAVNRAQATRVCDALGHSTSSGAADAVFAVIRTEGFAAVGARWPVTAGDPSVVHTEPTVAIALAETVSRAVSADAVATDTAATESAAADILQRHQQAVQRAVEHIDRPLDQFLQGLPEF